jgi:hypothetical protein
MSTGLNEEQYAKIKKLQKREKRHSFSPKLNTSLLKSRSTPIVNEPLEELDENSEVAIQTLETPKTPLKPKGSALNLGLAFELIEGKRIVTAGTGEKLLRTLVDITYNGNCRDRFFIFITFSFRLCVLSHSPYITNI